jgi:hypothetical protein
MYTGVNDIMQLERSPRSSLDDELLTACLKVLTMDQFFADFVVPTAMRTTLLVTMPTLDDIDTASVQRGDQSHGVVIPGVVGGHGRGGGPAGGHSGIMASGGSCGISSGSPAGGSGPTPAPHKGK